MSTIRKVYLNTLIKTTKQKKINDTKKCKRHWNVQRSTIAI